MRKLIFLVMIFAVTNIFSLDLDFLNLEKIPANHKLIYSIEESNDYETGNANVKETKIKVYSYKKNKKNPNTWYEIQVSGSNKMRSSVKILTVDGGKTIEDALIKLNDGKIKKVSKSKALEHINIFSDEKKELKNIGKMKVKFKDKNLDCNIFKADIAKENKNEKGNLIHQTDTNITKEYFVSTTRSCPFLIKGFVRQNTKKIGYHKGNKNYKFPNLNQDLSKNTEIKLMEFSKGNFKSDF